MVFDGIHNAEIYYGLGDGIKKALQFIKDTDFETMEAGKIEIDGENIYAILSKYNTKDPDDGKWEAHQKYVDVQYIVSGNEDFGFVNIDYLDEATEYDEENDVQFFEGEGDYIQLHEEEFVILYPHDVHMPCLSIEKSEEVLKVVVKVRVG